VVYLHELVAVLGPDALGHVCGLLPQEGSHVHEEDIRPQVRGHPWAELQDTGVDQTVSDAWWGPYTKSAVQYYRPAHITTVYSTLLLCTDTQLERRREQYYTLTDLS